MKPLLPDAQRLIELRSRGLTDQEIADRYGAARGSVASAICRAGKSNPRPRYEKHLPWRVKTEHGQHYAAKMLRNLGRRDAGGDLSVEQAARLDSWLRDLRDDGLVVTYDPETVHGFDYVPGWPLDGIPIRP